MLNYCFHIFIILYEATAFETWLLVINLPSKGYYYKSSYGFVIDESIGSLVIGIVHMVI